MVTKDHIAMHTVTFLKLKTTVVIYNKAVLTTKKLKSSVVPW